MDLKDADSARPYSAHSSDTHLRGSGVGAPVCVDGRPVSRNVVSQRMHSLTYSVRLLERYIKGGCRRKGAREFLIKLHISAYIFAPTFTPKS